MKNNSLKFVLWKTIICFLLAIFCKSSFAFLDPPVAFRAGKGITVHIKNLAVPCPASAADCNEYGLALVAFSPDINTNIISGVGDVSAGYASCFNGICSEQDVFINASIPDNTDWWSTTEIALELTHFGEYVRDIEYMKVPVISFPRPVIILDPGHGLLLGDDGRKHYQRPESPTFGLREDNLTLAMANAVMQQLANNGYEVHMT
jgi:hypothetical protein